MSYGRKSAMLEPETHELLIECMKLEHPYEFGERSQYQVEHHISPLVNPYGHRRASVDKTMRAALTIYREKMINDTRHPAMASRRRKKTVLNDELRRSEAIEKGRDY